jgi:hypothetical protein
LNKAFEEECVGKDECSFNFKKYISSITPELKIRSKKSRSAKKPDPVPVFNPFINPWKEK